MRCPCRFLLSGLVEAEPWNRTVRSHADVSARKASKRELASLLSEDYGYGKGVKKMIFCIVAGYLLLAGVAGLFMGNFIAVGMGRDREGNS